VPHHSTSGGAAVIGTVKFPSLILQIAPPANLKLLQIAPPGEKLSVAPPANFTIQQHLNVSRVRLDNTTI
jgi:hypothetical protein